MYSVGTTSYVYSAYVYVYTTPISVTKHAGDSKIGVANVFADKSMIFVFRKESDHFSNNFLRAAYVFLEYTYPL